MTVTTMSLDAAFAVFTDDVLSDEGLGFPDGTTYVPDERDVETARIVWGCLHEGRPAVLVGPAQPAILIEPIRPKTLGRLRNGLLRRVTVRLSYWYKTKGDEPQFKATSPIVAELGRHTLCLRSG